ncbi:MAG: hypothetical protein GWN87_24935 [Desulfuromonadales bacterium]|nr:hypothetical protein [Desulfuromonadales bacterium]
MQVMTLLNEEYPGKFKISDERVKLWRALLGDIDPQIVLTAALHLVAQGGQWPPTVGTVRATAKNFAHGELDAPSAHEAWGHVQARIQSDEAPLTDLEREVLKQVGTIYDLRRSSNAGADRAQFIRAFEQAVAREQLDRSTLPTVKMVVERQAAALPAPRPSAEQVAELVGAEFKGGDVKNLLKATGLIE